MVSALHRRGASLAGKEVFSTPVKRSATRWSTSHTEFATAQGVPGNYIDDPNAQGKYGGFAVLDAALHHLAGYQSRPAAQEPDRIASMSMCGTTILQGGADQPCSPAPGRSGYLSLNVKM